MKINSFYGQPQFQRRFGEQVSPGKWAISAAWQSGLSNSAVVGQLIGLVLNTEFQDRFGSRHTMMFFMVWLIGAIFIPFFAPSLPVLAVGEALCGIPWGVFQVSRCCFDMFRLVLTVHHRPFPPRTLPKSFRPYFDHT